MKRADIPHRWKYSERSYSTILSSFVIVGLIVSEISAKIANPIVFPIIFAIRAIPDNVVLTYIKPMQTTRQISKCVMFDPLVLGGLIEYQEYMTVLWSSSRCTLVHFTKLWPTFVSKRNRQLKHVGNRYFDARLSFFLL